jgi:bifunctional DNase/RNase
MLEIAVEGIGLDSRNYQPLVVLKEKAGERYLPIWIGSDEADAISFKLQGAIAPRPMSHDLLWTVIGELGASVDSIIINEIRDDTFYSKILLNTAEGQIDIDSRPSDALALALRAEAPIFVEDEVLDTAGVLIGTETMSTASQQASEEKGVSEDELGRLSAYTDFISTIDLENLGEGGQEKNED